VRRDSVRRGAAGAPVEENVRHLPHRARAAGPLGHPVRRGLHRRDGVGDRDRHADLAERRQIAGVVADEERVLLREAVAGEHLGDRSSLLLDPEQHVRNPEIARTGGDDGRGRVRDDRRPDPRRVEARDPMPVADVELERRQTLYGVRPGGRAEDAVDVEQDDADCVEAPAKPRVGRGGRAGKRGDSDRMCMPHGAEPGDLDEQVELLRPLGRATGFALEQKRGRRRTVERRRAPQPKEASFFVTAQALDDASADAASDG
jgi:hypothetical protein